jgi:hypothetical protein
VTNPALIASLHYQATVSTPFLSCGVALACSRPDRMSGCGNDAGARIDPAFG